MAYSTLYNVVGEACRKHYKQGSNFNENKFRSLRRWILVGVEEKECSQVSLFKWEEEWCSDNSV